MTRQTLRLLNKIVIQTVATTFRPLHEDYQALSDQLAAMATMSWPKPPLAACELADTAAMLRNERLRQRKSLLDLQAATGMAASTLSGIENQKHGKPTMASLERIADALGMELLVAMVKKEGQNDDEPENVEEEVQEPTP